MTETDTSRAAMERLIYAIPGVKTPREIWELQDRVASSIRALLARAEKAEAERDTAWNDAIEAAAKYHDNFLMTKTGIDVEKVIASTTAIRTLKKGDAP